MSPRLCNSGIEKFFVEAFALNTHYAFSGSNCNSGTCGSCVRQGRRGRSAQLIGIHQKINMNVQLVGLGLITTSSPGVLQKTSDARPDLIPDLAKRGQPLPHGALRGSGILEAPM
jgi:hypothetical protein